MANRKTAALSVVDSRSRVRGLYRWLLPVVSLREVRDRRDFLQASSDADALADWEIDTEAEADRLAIERDGSPIDARWTDLPKHLPPPLDTIGRDPAPRFLTVYPDDVVDASAWFGQLRTMYERARHFPNADHGFFSAAADLAKEYGV